MNVDFVKWFTTQHAFVIEKDLSYKNPILSTITNKININNKIESLYLYLEFINKINDNVNITYNIKIQDYKLFINIYNSNKLMSLDEVEYNLDYNLRDNTYDMFYDIFDVYFYKILNEEQRNQLENLVIKG
jgi:hypothetical protein